MKIGSSPMPNAQVANNNDSSQVAADRQALAGLATKAVAQTIVANTNNPGATITSQHPLLQDFGDALGMGLGVIVTEALRAIPSWNQPVLGPDGKPVDSVPGATRIGNNDILKRHEEVVGPQVAALVAKLPPGMLHDLLQGFADGATAAPGASYRLESAIADTFEDS
jgi:hypothetical protein